MSRIDWNDKRSLENLTPGQALQMLGCITEFLSRPQQTSNAHAIDHSARDQELAAAFALEAKRFHRGFVAAKDCRPALRQAADARRTEDKAPRKTDAEQAVEFAANARKWHR